MPELIKLYIKYVLFSAHQLYINKAVKKKKMVHCRKKLSAMTINEQHINKYFQVCYQNDKFLLPGNM